MKLKKKNMMKKASNTYSFTNKQRIAGMPPFTTNKNGYLHLYIFVNLVNNADDLKGGQPNRAANLLW